MTSGVAIMGATATGKSEVAIRLAHAFGAEVISMDSRQVYRRLDIGTAKLLPEQQAGVAHHLIDILDPEETHNAGRHVEAARLIAAQVRERGNVPLFVGGTGLYFRLLFRGLIDVAIPEEERAEMRSRFEGRSDAELYEELQTADPSRAAQLSPADRVRVARALEIYYYTGERPSRLFARQASDAHWRGPKVVLSLPRTALRQRIAERTRRMFEKGWVDEVRYLLEAGCEPDAPAMRSLGYDIIARGLSAGVDPWDYLSEVVTVTQQYAKRQETFWRSEEDAEWFDMSKGGAPDRVVAWVVERLRSNPT